MHSLPFQSGARPARGGIRLPLLLWAIVALAGALVVVIAARGPGSGGPEWQAASIYPAARVIEPFELADADGEPFTESELRGRLSLLFFGFTHCPDICPVTLAELAAARDKLERMRVDDLPQIVFVSVDPARDAGATMRDYVNNFDPAIRAVTGDDIELRALTGQLGALYARGRPDDSGYYGVDHSGMVVIVDSQGRMIGRFPPGSDAEAIAADLFTLIRRGA